MNESQKSKFANIFIREFVQFEPRRWIGEKSGEWETLLSLYSAMYYYILYCGNGLQKRVHWTRLSPCCLQLQPPCQNFFLFLKLSFLHRGLCWWITSTRYLNLIFILLIRVHVSDNAKEFKSGYPQVRGQLIPNGEKLLKDFCSLLH